MELIANTKQEKEFVEHYNALDRSVYPAELSFHVYKAYRAQLEDEEVHSELSEYSSFWNTVDIALNTTLIIALGRVFDRSGDAHCISQFLDFCERYPGIFTYSSIINRSRRASVYKARKEETEEHSDKWVSDDHSKILQDLKMIRSKTQSYEKIWNDRYLALRHKLIAHSNLTGLRNTDNLYRDTDVVEIEEIIDFLNAVQHGFQRLYSEGIRLNEKNWEIFTDHRDMAVGDLIRLINQLVNRNLPH